MQSAVHNTANWLCVIEINGFCCEDLNVYCN